MGETFRRAPVFPQQAAEENGRFEGLRAETIVPHRGRTDDASGRQLGSRELHSGSFAKYVGQKVIIRGESTPGEPRPVLKVRTMKTIMCAPQIQ